jgi:flavodoxin
MSRIMDVICFSGTGNTRLIVNHIENALKETGVKVCHIHSNETYSPTENGELLLAFPANSQFVSPYLWKFIRSLPLGKGTKVYVVLTFNDSAYILTPLKK